MPKPRGCSSTGGRRIARAAATSLLLLAMTAPALAYRPFDGTDAAVADLGELEVELQPAGRLQTNSNVSLIAPVAVINYGFAEGWEVVFQGQLTTPLWSSDTAALTNASMSLKAVLQPGSLQEKPGPSIAIEFALLMPDSAGDTEFGVSWAGIVSQRFDWGTVHFNVQTELTREQHADLFLDAIVEGPQKWPVRPVAEVFYEDEFGEARTVSGLVGLIWQVQDKLALDIGVRKAITDAQSVTEIRAGLTFGFEVGHRKP